MKREVWYVEWEDPTSQDDWTDFSEAASLECYIARTCGLLINESKTHICLALTTTEPNDSCSNFIVIPKSHIKYKKKLATVDLISVK